MSLLPEKFNLRAPTPTNIKVAPLPPSLQSHLEEANSDKDDIASLLGQNYLQFIHSHFLGARRSLESNNQESSRTQHTVWDRVVQKIKESTDVKDLPQAPTGLSFTVNEMIRQYSTAMDNLWCGSIYTKLLEYLLRVLLRLHLAPEREKRNMSRRQAQKKSRDMKHSNITNSAKKLKTKILCNELSDALKSDCFIEKQQYRVQMILGRLEKVNSHVSESPMKNLPPIDDQLQEYLARNEIIEDALIDSENDILDSDVFDEFDDENLEGNMI
jgi:hypothetical protein